MQEGQSSKKIESCEAACDERFIECVEASNLKCLEKFNACASRCDIDMS